MKDILMSASRQQSPLKNPIWAIGLVSLVSFFVIAAFLYHPRKSMSCHLISRGCDSVEEEPLVFPSRELTDDETVSQVVFKEILRAPSIRSTKSKIAFMFLTPGALPFESLWDRFFYGHEDKFSVYIHASKEHPPHVSPYFAGQEIHSEKVEWGKFSMVDAERRLLAHALMDPDNQQFVLLSDSCVPLHNFDYVYNYLMATNISFIDCFVDPGPHGDGRYSEHMLPEVEKKDFRKGSQWFSMKRQHAIMIMADSLYYTKFKLYCRPNMEGGRNCYGDEHYIPTLFNIIDPDGIAKWSVTHVDWSEEKWHPKSYKAEDITYELLKNITSIDEAMHVTSDNAKVVTLRPCQWNGMRRPCYLFARKFYPETMKKLMFFFSNYTTVF